MMFGFGNKKVQERRETIEQIVSALSVNDLLKNLGEKFEGGDELTQPTDFYKQVEESKKLWREGGNSVTSTLMDLRVQSASGYGTENLLKIDDKDGNYKMIFDYWAANVNRKLDGAYNIQPGLDALRKKWFTEYWRSGFVLTWWKREVMELPDGRKFTVPIAMGFTNPLSVKVATKDKTGKKFDLSISGQPFKYFLYKKDIENASDMSDGQIPEGEDWEELKSDEKNGFCVRAINCQDYEPYPVPFLAAKGVISLVKFKKVLMNSDYSVALRLIWSILLLKKGSDKLLERGLSMDALEKGLKQWKKRLEENIGKKKNAVLGETWDTVAEYIQPDVTSLLSYEKYSEVDMGIMEALGILQIGEGVSPLARGQAILNPKPLIQDITSALLEEKRFWEGVIFYDIWEQNKEIFEKKIEGNLFQLPNLYQKPMSIYSSPDLMKILNQLKEQGLVSNKTAIETIPGLHYEVERTRCEEEVERGDENIFKPPVMFRQTYREEGTEKKEEK